ncbi:MAG: hypothetical protein JW936_10565 [Sedimentisphaerales bacterium]|nr:hypothetical protein [Sedimentisphaerales bacterium]
MVSDVDVAMNADLTEGALLAHIARWKQLAHMHCDETRFLAGQLAKSNNLEGLDLLAQTTTRLYQCDMKLFDKLKAVIKEE